MKKLHKVASSAQAEIAPSAKSASTSEARRRPEPCVLELYTRDRIDSEIQVELRQQRARGQVRDAVVVPVPGGVEVPVRAREEVGLDDHPQRARRRGAEVGAELRRELEPEAAVHLDRRLVEQRVGG